VKAARCPRPNQPIYDDEDDEEDDLVAAPPRHVFAILVATCHALPQVSPLTSVPQLGFPELRSVNLLAHCRKDYNLLQEPCNSECTRESEKSSTPASIARPR